MTFSALVLDFDGTLVDTETPTYEVWRRLYSLHGFELSLDLWRAALGTHGGFAPADHLASLLGQESLAPSLRQAVDQRIRERCATQPLCPGVGELLHEARKLGLQLAVASSSSARWVDGWLHHHGLQDRFEWVVCRDHVAKVKPEPDLYLLAANLLGVEPSSCVAFEDSPNGARAALRAGMRCIVVPNAMTRQLQFPEVTALVPSLDTVPLSKLAEEAPVGARERWPSRTSAPPAPQAG